MNNNKENGITTEKNRTTSSSVKVSVVVPCYNVSQYLERCIASILSQTLTDLQIILIDDKSTDRTLSILRKFAKYDKRVLLIELPKNRGVAYARNMGLRNAKGEYVCFMDPDDYIDEDFLDALYNHGSLTKADIVKGFATNVKEISSTIKLNKLYFYAQWWSAIYKRELLTQHSIFFPEDVFCGQDFVFQRHACLLAQSVSLVTKETYYHYCKRKGSLDSPVFPLTKIKSQLLARKYIIQLANELCTNEDDYTIIIARLFSEIEWLWNKVIDRESHLAICEGYIDIYKELKYPVLVTIFPILERYLQKGNRNLLYNHLRNSNGRAIYKLYN